MIRPNLNQRSERKGDSVRRMRPSFYGGVPIGHQIISDSCKIDGVNNDKLIKANLCSLIMANWRDRISKFSGKTRFVVSRTFIHLAGDEIAPMLGVLNRVAREAIEADGDLEVLGEGLVSVCQNLLQMSTYWQSAANEGDVLWNEGEAGDYVNELFTDSAQRYLSEIDTVEDDDEPLSLPVTRNLVIMITVAFEGESADLETNLADIEALEYGLKALINLHYQEQLRAIQIHFSPARLGDELDGEQLLLNFPELIPL